MAKGGKDFLFVVGGGLAMASIVFGGGLLLFSDLHEPVVEAEHREEHTAEEPEASKEHDKKNDHSKEHVSTDPKGAHGHEKGAEKKSAPHSDQKSEHKPDKAENANKPTAPQEEDSLVKETDPMYAQLNLKMSEWFVKGEAALARGKADEARTFLTRAVKFGEGEGKPNPLALVRLAEATMQSEELPKQIAAERALELLNRIVAEYPDYAGRDEAHYHIAKIYRNLGRIQESREAYEMYLRLFPNGKRNAEARLEYAEALMVKNETHEALKLLDALVDEDLSPELRNRVMIASASGRLRLARTGEVSQFKNLPKAELSDVNRPNRATQLENLKDKGESEADPTDVKQFAYFLKQPPKDIPEAQWGAILNALENGKFTWATTLMEPWLQNPEVSADDRAKRMLVWAQVLTAMAYENKGTPPDEGGGN